MTGYVTGRAAPAGHTAPAAGTASPAQSLTTLARRSLARRSLARRTPARRTLARRTLARRTLARGTPGQQATVPLMPDRPRPRSALPPAARDQRPAARDRRPAARDRRQAVRARPAGWRLPARRAATARWRPNRARRPRAAMPRSRGSFDSDHPATWPGPVPVPGRSPAGGQADARSAAAAEPQAGQTAVRDAGPG